jgi:hypothetical protein
MEHFLSFNSKFAATAFIAAAYKNLHDVKS